VVIIIGGHRRAIGERDAVDAGGGRERMVGREWHDHRAKAEESE